MRDTILRFLGQLQESLKQSIEITTGSRTPWEELKQYSEYAPIEDRMDDSSGLGAEDNDDEESDTSDEGNNEPLVPQKNPATSEESKPEGLGAKPAHSPDQDKLKGNLMRISGPKTVISGTDVSKYRSNLDDHFDTETVISYVTTAKDVDGKSADLPPPPTDAYSKPDHRRVWRCFEQQHGNVVYKSKEQLYLHVSENHTDLTELQIRNLLGLVEATTIDSREVCPFCDSAGPFDKGLYNHMAFHQERLATFAAPRIVDEDNNDETNSSKAQGIRSTGSLRSISLHFSNILDVSVKAQGGEFSDALYAASEKGDGELVKQLLDQGANVNAQGGAYGNALQAASLDGNDEVVRLLLEKGADINAQGGQYGNALQAASLDGHEKVIRLLLEKEPNINAQGRRYGNALKAASV
ncbi:hypothetical protein DL771_000981 [Monosporascus sp. 5C6A]|nr:hypothetical protein DL771_000981 [Monosporascus sp. 5C6A]